MNLRGKGKGKELRGTSACIMLRERKAVVRAFFYFSSGLLLGIYVISDLRYIKIKFPAS